MNEHNHDPAFLARLRGVVQRLQSKQAELNSVNEDLLSAEHEYNELRQEHAALGERVMEMWRQMEYGPRKRTIECRSEIQAIQTEMLSMWLEETLGDI